jgi:hypothetical protein
MLLALVSAAVPDWGHVLLLALLWAVAFGPVWLMLAWMTHSNAENRES